MKLTKFIPLALLVIVILLVVSFDLQQYLSFDVLKAHQERVLDFVNQHWVLSVIIYMAIYASVVALSIPGGTFMTLIGGFLFGLIQGTIIVVLAATIGATILFIIAKTSLGDLLQQKAAPWLEKMSKGFQENAFHYMLVVRLVPLFPFFVVNLVPAFLGISTRTYILSTLLGIIPGTFVYVSVGTGLGSILATNDEFTTAGLLTHEILLAFIGLALLSILPVLYKRFKR